MMETQQTDCGVYHQVPFFYLLRNGCAPALASIIVKEFRNIGFHEKNRENLNNTNVPGTNRPLNQQQKQYIDLDKTTLNEFLKKINNRGKKEEERRKKLSKQGDEHDSDKCSRTLHLNNLKENEESLKKFNKASDLLSGDAKATELIDTLRKFDVTFLINLITNDILDYQVHEKLNEAVCVVKEIRNCLYHSGRKVEYEEFQKMFKKLHSALKVMYEHLYWKSSELDVSWKSSKLDEKVQKAQEMFMGSLDIIASNILADMQQELAAEEQAKSGQGSQDSFVSPLMMDTRKETRPTAIIENFEKFLGENELPVVLCGPPGSGKSTILQHYAQKFYHKNHSMQYKLVIHLESSDRITHHCDFSDLEVAVQKKICNSCSKTVKSHGIELCLWVLKMFSKDIIFFVNWNVSILKDKRGDGLEGKWIFCSQSFHDWSPYYCVVKIMPLNETLVKQMLESLLPHGERQHVIGLYDGCDYKGLISNPDMVKIFSEVRNETPCNQLLQSYIDTRLANSQNSDLKCVALGEKAFHFILDNKKEYLNTDLSDISDEVKSVFLVPIKHNTFTFISHVIEDLLAAKYIIAKPKKACKKWITQVPLFKRVFRFVCANWCQNGVIQKEYLDTYLKPYLTKYFEIKSPRKKPREGRNLPVDILYTDFSKEDSFTKWSYVIHLAECCKFQSDVMQLLCDLLSQKTTWIFKCKWMDTEKVDLLFKILKEIQPKKPIVIKIESGTYVETLVNVWKMLSKLPGLHDNATVQITILHKEFIPVTNSSNLLMLPDVIANLGKPLYVTKYKGPLLCTESRYFLKCHCMRRVEVLDVCVYDRATLKEALCCEGLENLKAVIIKVYLGWNETESTEFSELRVPDLQEGASLTLSVKYFDGLQRLLEAFENKRQLKTLSISGMRVKSGFKFDLSTFTGLESLFIHFNHHAAQRSESFGKDTPMDLDYSDQGMSCEQPMDLDHLGKGMSCKQPKNTHHSESRMQESPWTFEFSMNLHLPKTLERLLLRNTGFCNDSNCYLMIRLWKNHNIQRLTLLDSNLSLKGVRDILQSHIVDNDLEQKMKRHRLSGDETHQSRVCVQKKPRLCKEEREQRRRNKPSGKELIITSQLKLCGICKQFPCSCERLAGEDCRDSVEDVVHLIEDACRYDILSLNYCSEIVTVRKDMCGDLRVHCPLTGVDDDTLKNLDKGDKGLKLFFESLTLAQHITLDFTKLTLDGAKLVIDILLKSEDREPFSLCISSFCLPTCVDEVKNSTFIHILLKEDRVNQFKMCNCNDKGHYIKKTLKKQIYMNDECLC